MSLDRDDVVALYERHSEELLGFLARRTGNRQLARDLLGDTFLSAFAAREQCRAEDEPQRLSWLYRIAANKLYEHTRHHASERRALRRLGRQQPAAASDPGYERVEQLAQASGLRPELDAALAQLSDEQADAIRSRVIEDRDYPQVAALLGVGEDAARARVSRGLSVLRRAIGGSVAVGVAVLLATHVLGSRPDAHRQAPAHSGRGAPQGSAPSLRRVPAQLQAGPAMRAPKNGASRPCASSRRSAARPAAHHGCAGRTRSTGGHPRRPSRLSVRRR